MAFGATTIFEVHNAGVDGTTGNGGSFDPGNANMATDGAATSATGTAPVFSSASYNFAARDVGASAFIKSGTNWIPAWYPISSVASNNATLNAAVGAAALWKNPNATVANTPGIPVPNTVAGCATVASPTAATWSVDYSIQDAAGITYTDGVIDATTNTKYTSAANPVGVNVIGNMIAWSSGAGWTVQRAQVVSVSGTVGTCDVALGTTSSTGGNGKLGGALASPGQAGAVAVAGNWLYLKYNATFFSVTSNTNNIAGGGINWPSGTGTTRVLISGYNAVRGDLETVNNFANFPTYGTNNVTGNTSGMIQQGSYTHIRCLTVDGSTGATKGYRLISLGQYGNVENVKANVFTNLGIYLTISGTEVRRCWATGGTSAAVAALGMNASGIFEGCVATANACPGVYLASSAHCTALRCVSANNTTANGHGFQTAGTYGGRVYNCVGYNNAGDGMNVSGASAGDAFSVRNSIFTKNAGYGINNSAGTIFNIQDIDYNYLWSNTSGAFNNVPAGPHDIYSGTADPFTNAAGLDFSLNNTNPGGAQCRGAGYPGVFPNGISTTGYLDIGAAQTQASAAGGLLVHPGFGGGMRG